MPHARNGNRNELRIGLQGIFDLSKTVGVVALTQKKIPVCPRYQS
jgi:hypothetical protein